MPTGGTADVYLGQDETLSTTEYGDNGTNSTGFQISEISDLDADHDSSVDEAYAEVGNSSGDGSLTAWAYVGRTFEVKDNSGSQDATITFNGGLFGAMSLDGASNYVKAEMTVEDQTDDEKYDEVLYEKSDYIGSIDENITDSTIVPLEAGHFYGVKAEVLAEITVTEAGDTAISDFHRDGSRDGWLYWDQVDIKF